MAAKIEFQRHKDKTASIDELLAHDKYLNDPTHDDHEGYTMMPGKNYNCPGETVDDLVAAVNLAHTNHIRRKKFLKHRRRTNQLWGEGIFCLGIECYATKDEREKIEREYIRRFFPDTAARAYWHVNEETGNCDLHIIFAYKRRCGKLTLERTETGMMKRMQALDRYAADLLNSNPHKPAKRIPDIRTSEDTADAHADYYSGIREEKEAAELAEAEVKNPKKKTAKKSPTKTTAKKSTRQSRALAAQVARKAEEEGIGDVEAQHLPGILERIGIKILQPLNGIIKYVSSRKTRKGKTVEGEVRIPRTGIIRIHDFLFDVLHHQVDLRIERAREMADLTEAQPTVKVPATPATLLKTRATKSVAKKTSGKTPAEKAALLQAFLEAALGRTKVKAKKLKSLTTATKGMLKSDGTIEPSLLKILTDEQKAVLVPLSEAYTQQIG